MKYILRITFLICIIIIGMIVILQLYYRSQVNSIVKKPTVNVPIIDEFPEAKNYYETHKEDFYRIDVRLPSAFQEIGIVLPPEAYWIVNNESIKYLDRLYVTQKWIHDGLEKSSIKFYYDNTRNHIIDVLEQDVRKLNCTRLNVEDNNIIQYNNSDNSIRIKIWFSKDFMGKYCYINLNKMISKEVN